MLHQSKTWEGERPDTGLREDQKVQPVLSEA
jgi:hypothetical protein